MSALAAVVLVAGLSVGDADFVAPPACPAEGAFWTAVRERLPSIGSSTVALDVHVTITATGSRFAGETRVELEAPRRLTASSCEDLIRALALVTALLVDAEPRRAEAEVAVPPKPAPAPPPAPAAEEESRAEVSFGVDAAVTWGVVPGGSLVVPLFMEVKWPDGPRFRAVFRRASSEAEDLGPAAVALFSWTVGRVEVCPLEIDAEVASAMACASIEGGLVDADAAGVFTDGPSSLPWFAAGALGRLRFPVMDGQVFIEASGGVSVPFLRHRYLFGRDLEVHVTAPVVGELGGGAGLVF